MELTANPLERSGDPVDIWNGYPEDVGALFEGVIDDRAHQVVDIVGSAIQPLNVESLAIATGNDPPSLRRPERTSLTGLDQVIGRQLRPAPTVDVEAPGGTDQRS